MPLTSHDILMDADLFRRCYPGWPLTGRDLTRYDDDPGFAITPRDLPGHGDEEGPN